MLRALTWCCSDSRRDDRATLLCFAAMTPKPVQLILLPTDLTRDSSAPVRYGIDLAAQLGAALRFFAVLDSPSQLALVQRHGKADRKRDASFREKLIEDAKSILSKLVEDAAAVGVEASGRAVIGERVDLEVLREARESGVDLIIVESHEQSLLQDFLFGDNSEEITHLAPCPVLTIRSHGDEDAS